MFKVQRSALLHAFMVLLVVSNVAVGELGGFSKGCSQDTRVNSSLQNVP